VIFSRNGVHHRGFEVGGGTVVCHVISPNSTLTVEIEIEFFHRERLAVINIHVTFVETKRDFIGFQMGRNVNHHTWLTELVPNKESLCGELTERRINL
jgi:hypothetical protein